MNSTAHDVLDAERVGAALGPRRDLYRIECLQICESTNSQLLERAACGAPSGQVLASEVQTAGRGRRGRSWHSVPGASLTFSVLWRFPPAMPVGGLSLAVGVALVRALERAHIGGIALKWPNDLLADGRKLAGVLIEMVPGEPGAVVVGIGLNVRLPTELAERIDAQAVAVADLIGEVPSRNELLAAVLDELAAAFARFESQGFSALRDDWLARHAHQGLQISLTNETGLCLQGLCLGVDHDGALLVRTADGVQRVVSGEVSLRMP